MCRWPEARGRHHARSALTDEAQSEVAGRVREGHEAAAADVGVVHARRGGDGGRPCVPRYGQRVRAVVRHEGLQNSKESL